jgi:anti-sigma B factor antagonist
MYTVTQTKVDVRVRQVSDAVICVDIGGSVTGSAENALMDAWAQASAGTGHAIILNFTGLEYMNSSGIGLLITFLVRANRQGHRLLAYGLNQHYRQIFELTRLNEAIRILDSEAEALAAAE